MHIYKSKWYIRYKACITCAKNPSGCTFLSSLSLYTLLSIIRKKKFLRLRIFSFIVTHVFFLDLLFSHITRKLHLRIFLSLLLLSPTFIFALSYIYIADLFTFSFPASFSPRGIILSSNWENVILRKYQILKANQISLHILVIFSFSYAHIMYVQVDIYTWPF